MLRYEKRFWALAALLAGLAGYVDAIGFLKLGGLFVSFMSGNSTRLAVGTAIDPHVSEVAAGLILSFIVGVITASLIGARFIRHRTSAVMLLVAILLAGSATVDTVAGSRSSAFLLALAMGAENAVFERNGEVSIGVTYLTGSLVKLGQGVASALLGGPRLNWVPYLMLWCALTGGAVIGTLAYNEYGAKAIAAPAVASMLLALLALGERWAERSAQCHSRAD